MAYLRRTTWARLTQHWKEGRIQEGRTDGGTEGWRDVRGEGRERTGRDRKGRTDGKSRSCVVVHLDTVDEEGRFVGRCLSALLPFLPLAHQPTNLPGRLQGKWMWLEGDICKSVVLQEAESTRCREPKGQHGHCENWAMNQSTTLLPVQVAGWIFLSTMGAVSSHLAKPGSSHAFFLTLGVTIGMLFSRMSRNRDTLDLPRVAIAAGSVPAEVPELGAVAAAVEAAVPEDADLNAESFEYIMEGQHRGEAVRPASGVCSDGSPTSFFTTSWFDRNDETLRFF